MERIDGNAGLTDIVARTHTLSALSQFINEIRESGFTDLSEEGGEVLLLYIESRAFRKYAKEITPSYAIIKSLFAYLGFGYMLAGMSEAQQ